MSIEVEDKSILIQKALANIYQMESLILNYDYDNIIIDTDVLNTLPMNPTNIPNLIWEINQITLKILQSLKSFIAENQLSLDDPTLEYLANNTDNLRSTYPNFIDYESIIGLPSGGAKLKTTEILLSLPFPVDLQSQMQINTEVIKVLLGYFDIERFANLSGFKNDPEKIRQFINDFMFLEIRKTTDAVELLPTFEERVRELRLADEPEILDLINTLVDVTGSFRSIVGPATYSVSVDLYPNIFHHYQATWSFMQIAIMMRYNNR